MDLTCLAEIVVRYDGARSSYGFSFEHLLVGLMWGVWVVLNLWIWQKTKALGNMLMLCGAGALALCHVLRSFTWGPTYFIDFLGIGALTAGFFLSVKPIVDAQLKALQAKLHSATHSKSDTGTPPKA